MHTTRRPVDRSSQLARWFTVLLTFGWIFPLAAQPARFEFAEGDRIALVGDTLIEREGDYGHIETRLTAEFPDRHLVFRNLGWSGDWPDGRSRASFDWNKSPAEWRARLLEQIRLVRPTVVMLGYGMAASFEGEPGLRPFRESLDMLAAELRTLAPENPPRLVVLGIIRHEALPGLPDPAPHNRQIDAYNQVLREFAVARGARFIPLDALPGPAPLTDNGIHLTASGYARAAEAIAAGLGWTSAGGALTEAGERLRRAIVEKNRHFFNRWRPQNHTYLFGFRKHEQGQNAREIPIFDELIEAQEKIVAGLRKPAAEIYTPGRDSTTRTVETSATAVVRIAPNTDAATDNPASQFTLAEGFEINLYAASPLLAKPIQMNFDAQGRLWVAGSRRYPQIAPGEPADDKIIVLEDLDGDGVAEKSTVFADGLLIPSGVEPGDGGVYVAASTELLFFKDHDGDGRADERRVILSGFGTEDTHHTLHSLRWGHDGHLYFNQSIYIHSHIETPRGVRRLNSGGVWRFHPGTRDLAVFLRGFCNPWGHHFDAFGQSFVTDGAGFQGVSWGLEGATYFTYSDMRREMRSISPGNYPKFCGLEVIESEHFPPDWQGDLVTADFRAHRIVRFRAHETGAGYVTSALPDLLRTTNVTFRPIDLKLGPDGALYLADWSNPIIQHGEVDFRDSRRDRVQGRIWRVTAKGRSLVPRKDFTRLANDELLDLLLSKNNFDRQRARRVLTERDAEGVTRGLTAWSARQTGEQAAIESLWMHQALAARQPEPPGGAISEAARRTLDQVLNASDGRIRAAGVRVLRHWLPALQDSDNRLGRLIRDPHPRVRAEVLRALAAQGTSGAAALALTVVDQEPDPFLEYAAWLTINDLAEPWAASVRSGVWTIPGREKQMQFAMSSIRAETAAPLLASLLEQQPLARDGAGPWIDLIGRAGSEKELAHLFDRAVRRDFDPPALARALHALADSAQNRKVRPAGELGAARALAGQPDQAVREAATRLAAAWKIDGGEELLAALALDPSPSISAAAFRGLRDFGTPSALRQVEKLAERNQSERIRHQAVLTLSSLDLKAAMPRVLETLEAISDENAAAGFWRALLENRGAARALSAALLQIKPLPATAARAGLRVAREGGRNEPDLVLALVRTPGVESADSVLGEAEILRLLGRVNQEGDAARGELVYRRNELGCVACHAIGGVGGKLGPDLTSIGASAPLDYLVESILFPERKIKEGYHAVNLATKDGLDLSGVIVRENEREVVLRNAANQDVTVSKTNIEQRSQGGSLMPAGLLAHLPLAEQLDLYRFLSALGKPGPFDASKGNVARVWRVRPALHTEEQFGPAAGGGRRTTWQTLLTLTDGRLPAAALAEGAKAPMHVGVTGILAETRLVVPVAGEVRFLLSSEGVMGGWINGKPVKPGEQFSAPLEQGTHTLTLKLDRERLPEFLRLETADGTFLTEL